ARRYIDQVISLMDMERTEAAIDCIIGDGNSPDEPVESDSPQHEQAENATEIIEAATAVGSEEADQASADVFDHAGDIYFMTGEPEQALNFWKRALELDPDNELIQKKVKYKAYFYE
ncbi:MAG: tetratricopeptide repeat protein, partial [Muribaculaceae bacterium]|nr:tetratricopeptide repeat protein [Muribaculaceae bacterium]